MLSEKLRKKLKIICFHLYKMSRIGKSTETKTCLMAAYNWGWGRTDERMGDDK